MKKIAKKLADYVIQKGTIEEEEREIYEYGFSIATEMLLCILVCFSISMTLHTFVEGLLFFCDFYSVAFLCGRIAFK